MSITLNINLKRLNSFIVFHDIADINIDFDICIIVGSFLNDRYDLAMPQGNDLFLYEYGQIEFVGVINCNS